MPGPSGAAPLRVALFTDSFLETNGVATLSRAYVQCATESATPFLCVYGADQTAATRYGSVELLSLARGPLAFPVDAGTTCDPFLARHRDLVLRSLRAFAPEVIHITGPGDVGILGFWASNTLRIPMMASWHTNLHDYAERRLRNSLRFLPAPLSNLLASGARRSSFWALAKYYKLAHFVASPNEEIRLLLGVATTRPSFHMGHGVDTNRFTPARRATPDQTFRIGYVGRLTPEKNVRALARVESQLLDAGESGFRFLIVGSGSESPWLRQNLLHADFTGSLAGEDLAAAFARMDALVFPSYTDTFGLVILEALASGVPVILPPEAGRRAGVIHGVTGFLSDDFTPPIQTLLRQPALRARMSAAARSAALARSWPAIFQDLQNVYRNGLASDDAQRRIKARH